jgi:hypothetical protein
MLDQETIDEFVEAVGRAAYVVLLNYKRGNCSRYVARRQLVLVFNVPLNDVEALLEGADKTPLVVMERRWA